jgi:hypothetical protein
MEVEKGNISGFLMYYDFGGKARRKETTRKTQDIGGRIILKWILER